MNKTFTAEVYIASEIDPPQKILIEDESIQDIVERMDSSIKQIDFRTCTDSRFFLKNIKSLNHQDEVDFHNRLLICVIDGNSFEKYYNEILTIRAHHYPFVVDAKTMCIVNFDNLIPEEKISSGELLTVQEQLKYIEDEIFNCELLSPTKDAFKIELKTAALILKNEYKDYLIYNKMFPDHE